MTSRAFVRSHVLLRVAAAVCCLPPAACSGGGKLAQTTHQSSFNLAYLQVWRHTYTRARAPGEQSYFRTWRACLLLIAPSLPVCRPRSTSAQHTETVIHYG